MGAGKKECIKWLEVIDSGSAKLPRTRSRANNSFFFFARYPHLQPAGITPRKQQLRLEVCRETFQEELRNWERRIEQNQFTSRILEGPDSAQRAALSALTVDCNAEIGDYVSRLPNHKRLRMAASEGARAEWRLERELKSSHETVYKLISLLSG
jgi:hypothetical protein